MQYHLQFCSPQFKKDMARLQMIHRVAVKMTKELKNLPYKERWKESGLFSLQKRRLRRDHTRVFQDFKGSYKEDKGSLFTRRHMEKTRRNGYKMHQEGFHLNLKRKFFTVRKISHWNNLPRDMVDFLLLEVFKV